MNLTIEKIKGIPPSAFLQREIKSLDINQKKLAMKIGEYPQTLNAVLNGKRKITIHLALKLEKELGLPEGFISILQTYHEIKQEKSKQIQQKPDLSIITRGLFWEYDLEKMDWLKYANFIIERTFERGNEAEKKEILRFYGEEKVKFTLEKPKREPMRIIKNNLNAIL